MSQLLEKNRVQYIDTAPLIAYSEYQYQQLISSQQSSPEHESYKTQEEWNGLKNTGFNVWSELARFSANCQKYLRLGESHQEAAFRAFQEVKSNIIGFKLEYLMKGEVLPSPANFETVDGQIRLGFNGRSIVDTITEKERNGAVKQAYTEAEKKLLSNSQSGDIVVITSPPGWSGMTTADGKPYTYTDTQTYIMRVKEDRSLESCTLVTKWDYERNRALLEALGVDSKEFDKAHSGEERIESIVRNFAYVPANGKKTSIKDIAGVMEQVEKQYQLKHPGLPEDQKQDFSNIYNNINRRDELLCLDDKCEALLQGFQAKISNLAPLINAQLKMAGLGNLDSLDPEPLLEISNTRLKDLKAVQVIGKELSELILKIYIATVGEDLGEQNSLFARFSNQSILDRAYLALTKISGCAGGGVSIIQTPLGARRVRFGELEGWHYDHCRMCDPDKKESPKWVGKCKVCKSCEDKDNLKP